MDTSEMTLEALEALRDLAHTRATAEIARLRTGMDELVADRDAELRATLRNHEKRLTALEKRVRR